MDASINEENETVRGSRRLKSCEADKDLFSELPAPVLVHILSFLPLRDAIKTALLRPFRDIRLSIPVLDLNNCSYDRGYFDYKDEYCCDCEKFLDIIHEFCDCQDVITVDKLHLKCRFSLHYSKNGPAFDNGTIEDYEGYVKGKKEREKTGAVLIGNLICCAVSRKVKVLDLNFQDCACYFKLDPSEHYELPHVFRSHYLTDLQLTECDFRSCKRIDLQALRVLFLWLVSLSDEIM